MAFLCPSGLGRSKQRREIHNSILERVHGDVGFDSVLRPTFGQYPEALVLHNFTASSREELTVRQGQKIHILLREGDWVYVVNSDKKEGFIPFTACAQIVPAPTKKALKSDNDLIQNDASGKKKVDPVNNNTYNVKKSAIVHREPTKLDNSFHSNFVDNSFVSSDWSNNTHKHHVSVNASRNKHESQSGDHYDDNRNIIKSFFESTPYEKLPKFLEIFKSLSTEENIENQPQSEVSPRDRNWSADPNDYSFMSEGSTEILDDTYIALFDFRGRHTDDVDVKQDERVTVLDKTDPFWYWIKKEDGKTGYVPSNYIGHTEDPKVATLLGNRKQREGVCWSHPHSPDCKCEGCFNTSPFSETSSVTSSTLNSETKHRPPKPPRTRKQTPRDSVKVNRKLPSDIREKEMLSKKKCESGRNSSRNKHSSILSSHHLSLENLSIKTDKTDCSDYDPDTSRNQANSQHPRKRSSRHKKPNYREYRSNSQRSYTFEESRDYFDAYFCDEPDPNFKTKSDDNDIVINVAEILKTRSASTGANNGALNKNKWMKSGSADHGHDILNMRQFMRTLPSTTICNENNTKREGNASDLSNTFEKGTKSSTDKHARGQTKNLDWSFGYPRKVRSNQNSISSSSHAVHKQQGTKLRLTESSSAIQARKHSNKQRDKEKKISRDVKSVGSQTDVNDISVQAPEIDDPSDRMFLDLLSATDNLLEVSEKILTNSKSRKKTSNLVNNSSGDRRSSSSETNDDVDEKCSHFIMNQVIDTNFGQLTNRSETSIAGTPERNADSPDDYETKYENKELNILPNQSDHKIPSDLESFLSTSNEDKRIGSHGSQTNDNAIRNKSNASGKIERNIAETCDKKDDKSTDSNKLSTHSDSDCVFDDVANRLDVHGVTEFVVQWDYEPESDMALPIIKNEILHISLDIQEDDHWYWAFSPRLRTNGYVPKQYVKIPLVTII